MSALDKITKAKPTQGGNNIKDGNYTLLVEKVIYDPKGYSGATFVMEYRVIKAESNGATDEMKNAPRGNLVVPNPVGTTCSNVCLLDSFDNAGGNAKAALLGAMIPLGYTDEMITEAVILEVSGPNNPLRGIAVRLETYRGWNKGKKQIANRDKPLTLCSWKPVTQTREDIAAQRAWLDSNNAKVETAIPTPGGTVLPAQAPAAPTPVEPPAPVASSASVTPAAPATSSLLAGLGVK
jgi:hypothetical protein